MLKGEPSEDLPGKHLQDTVSVTNITVSRQEQKDDPYPGSKLPALAVLPIPVPVARKLLERHHYLHSLPGGTMLRFGVFASSRLLGVLTFGAGPALAYSLVEAAQPQDCLTLTRLWLADELPANSESRILGRVIRYLRQYTHLKFLVAYSDPTASHIGVIYQATNWLYTGLSAPTPLYDLGDHIPRHSRSVAHAFGTHSLEYFARHGMLVKLVSQSPKYRYLFFLDPRWRPRLKVPVLPYPKKGDACENHQS